MPQSPRHFIILPYFCQEEITRYLQIAERLASYPQPLGGYHFLLASSPQIETSQLLIEAYSQIGEVIPFACPTQIYGYPQGPTAMFWDCMDFLADHFGNETGFGLWLESDMAPTQPDWIDRLSSEWYEGNERPIMMGCYIPEVFRQRWFKPRKLILHAHINGGACYSLNFARQMPEEAREGVFDMAVYQYAARLGKIKSTSQIAFSTLGRVRRDLFDTSKVLLHGFMQEKDQFIQKCLDPITEEEQRRVAWHRWSEQLEAVQRRIRVQFVRRGKQAMYENMWICKARFDRGQRDRLPSKERSTRVA